MNHVDFVFPDRKLFPISQPEDIKRAIDCYQMFSKEISYDEFAYKLCLLAKKRGDNFLSAVPHKIRQRTGFEKSNRPESENKSIYAKRLKKR